MTQYPHWIWEAVEVNHVNPQITDIEKIRLIRKNTTPIPVVCILLKDLSFSSGSSLPRGTILEGAYHGVPFDYTPDASLIHIVVEDITYAFKPENIALITADTRHCFRCDIYHTTSKFKRDGRVKDKSPILSEVCEHCYRKLVNKMQEFDGKARKHGGKGLLKVSQWLEKLKASNGYCHYCKEFIGLHLLIVEHVKPLSKGGDNSIENVVPACVSCNSSKHDRDYETWQRHNEAHRLMQQLQEHLGLSKFEVTNLAVKHLATHLGLVDDQVEEVDA